jgi:hypothetical protein
MNNRDDKGEIIIYQSDDKSTHLEVRINEETIWLTQKQMALLFDCSVDNVGLHLKNIYKEEELQELATAEDFSVVRQEGSRFVKRKVVCYNLDAVISVGYRVNSKRGTQFRIWANRVLKDYLLKGYVINQRVDRIEKKLFEHDQKFDLLIKTNLPATEGIFYEGQIFDAYQFASDIIKSANKSIVLIDNYVDESVLTLLSKRNSEVTATIYTASISKQLKLDLKRFNAQYPAIEVKTFTKSHDRFLIIDHATVYHIGASLKDLGKKWFAFSKMELNALEIIKKLTSVNHTEP